MRYITIILLLIATTLKAQHAETELRYEVYAPIEFYFNSLDKIITGSDLNNYNQFRISCIDTTDVVVIIPSTWTLEVISISGNFVGEETGSILPLEILEFDAVYISGLNDALSTYYTDVPLTSGLNLLVDNGRGIDPSDLATDPKYTVVSISYHCGKTVPIGSAKSDHYVAEIQFSLKIK